MKRIPYGRHHITSEDLKAVNETLLSDFITQGPRVDEFEKAFAEYIGVKYAVAVSNGTAALDVCVKALESRPGDRFITTPITFVASANCVKFNNGDISFCDIDRKTYLMDLNLLEDMLKKEGPGKYKAVIPVDFAGYPVNLEELKYLAEKYDFRIIEDACHAPGGAFMDSKSRWQKCGNGNFADLSIFSFHPVKHIATGEGGMITTNSQELYQRMLKLRSHGITREPELLLENHGGWYYEMQELSHNFRLTDFQAALGISQLKRAEEGLQRRRQIAEKYYNDLKETDGLVIPEISNGIRHAYHLFVVETSERKRFYDYLREKGIFAQVHYIPVHLMPYYRQFGWEKGDFPQAEDYYERCISLPMFPSLSEEDQCYVIDMIKKFFQA
ncbi:MAG: UDP-4-amino-4,6-dideoxy-N-acetyl-beta-L-altrosamine transaminase [Bacteroidales bacterium]|nr:UDP-4-amino-4,6-dideoxy-N-acetyl-beta-L-altrosamine transaminase [Bacteroidales bacterium]